MKVSILTYHGSTDALRFGTLRFPNRTFRRFAWDRMTGGITLYVEGQDDRVVDDNASRTRAARKALQSREPIGRGE